MALKFPRLHTGAVAQFPLTGVESHNTHVSRFADGSEQRFRNLAVAGREWRVRLSKLTDEESDKISWFFMAHQGRQIPFTFIDPWTGAEITGCRLSMDEVEAQFYDENCSEIELIIRRYV